MEELWKPCYNLQSNYFFHWYLSYPLSCSCSQAEVIQKFTPISFHFVTHM